jgi:signal transduction histidine kinase
MIVRVRFAALLGLLAFASWSGAAEPPVRQILVLQSFSRGNLILDHFTSNFRFDLDRRVGGSVNYVQFTVGQTGFVGPPEKAVVDFIRSTYAGRPGPDLIVTFAGPAAVFARKYHKELFPDTPLLLGAIDQRYLGDAPLAENEAAVTAIHDFPGVMDDILQVRPQTRQVFMVNGSGVIGKFWRHRLEEQFSRFHDRLTFVWSDNLSLQEILRRCSTLPANSAIFFLTLGTDATGVAYADERVLADLHATANAPLFSAHDVYLGSGIVGGRLMPIDELTSRLTDSAYRILNGESPSDISVPPQVPGQPKFDWRELKRWDIPESRLPPGSLVKFRAPTLWSEHRGTVLIAAGALAIQALLIIGLLFERRARRRAEFESRRNLALAADTSRRETMSALTSTIAHELGQPLSAMLHNAEALQMLVDTNRATPETIREILVDINADGIRAAEIIERHRAMLRSHQLQKKTVDLQAVVNDAVALLAYDVRARQIVVTVKQPSISCLITGDPVLLQQVLVNLLINAMDAMAETPPDRRHITIKIEIRRAEAEVSVRDNGPGVPPDLIGRLFTPFVTTKSHGLGIGLAIARNIVEAHGGSISARNNPEGGATFAVTLRLSEAHGKMPGPPVTEPTVSESMPARASTQLRAGKPRGIQRDTGSM